MRQIFWPEFFLAIDRCSKLGEPSYAIGMALKDTSCLTSIHRESGFTALHFSALLGFVEMVRFLIEQGADLQLPDRLGRWPFELARLSGDKETIELLEAATFPDLAEDIADEISGGDEVAEMDG